MVVRVVTNLVNGVYSAQISTEPDSNELAYFGAYGEPQINVGGTITYSGEATFALQDSMRLLRSQFPNSFSADSNVDVDAAAKVTGWVTTVRGRIQTALNTLAGKQQPTYPQTQVFTHVGVD